MAGRRRRRDITERSFDVSSVLHQVRSFLDRKRKKVQKFAQKALRRLAHGLLASDTSDDDDDDDSKLSDVTSRSSPADRPSADEIEIGGDVRFSNIDDVKSDTAAAGGDDVAETTVRHVIDVPQETVDADVDNDHGSHCAGQ